MSIYILFENNTKYKSTLKNVLKVISMIVDQRNFLIEMGLIMTHISIVKKYVIWFLWMIQPLAKNSFRFPSCWIVHTDLSPTQVNWPKIIPPSDDSGSQDDWYSRAPKSHPTLRQSVLMKFLIGNVSTMLHALGLGDHCNSMHGLCNFHEWYWVIVLCGFLEAIASVVQCTFTHGTSWILGLDA